MGYFMKECVDMQKVEFVRCQVHAGILTDSEKRIDDLKSDVEIVGVGFVDSQMLKRSDVMP